MYTVLKSTDLDSFIKKNTTIANRQQTFFLCKFSVVSKTVKSTSPKLLLYVGACLMKTDYLFCLFNSHNMKCLEKHQQHLGK